MSIQNKLELTDAISGSIKSGLISDGESSMCTCICINTLIHLIIKANHICCFKLLKAHTSIQREKQMEKEIQNKTCLILSTAFQTSEVISV